MKLHYFVAILLWVGCQSQPTTPTRASLVGAHASTNVNADFHSAIPCSANMTPCAGTVNAYGLHVVYGVATLPQLTFSVAAPCDVSLPDDAGTAWGIWTVGNGDYRPAYGSVRYNGIDSAGVWSANVDVFDASSDNALSAIMWGQQ